MIPTFSLVSGAALACGGMFCDPGPLEVQVVQNAERIAFHVDEDAGTVEAHVQIFYEGPPDAFGWVVPVAKQPEVFLSTDALFDVLAQQLAPTVRLDQVQEGNCRFGRGGGIGCTSEMSLNAAPREVDVDADTDDAPVSVVDDGQVGPYDYVVLQASTSDALLAWLGENSYAVPDGLSGVLQPYLASDSHFLAVRLSKDRDTGDIAPLGWRYTGDAASIPIQLTSIASAPDLRLEVSVFGAARAVPTSYLHVAINEANLDWFSGGTNYYDVVSRAADQAGGHAFATDYAGPVGFLAGSLWNGQREAGAEAVVAATDPLSFFTAWNDLQLGGSANVVAAFAGHGVAVDDFGQLLTAQDLVEVDLALLAADLERFVFAPYRRGEALFEQPWVTRLSSSLDADEMTVDPVFELNADMAPVDNRHEATMFIECNGKQFTEAPRRLELSDGRAYRFPPTGELGGRTDSELWLARSSAIEAIRIEQPSKHGQPEVIADMTEDAWAEVDGVGGKCGCTPSAAPFAGSVLALFGALLARRRTEW
ncbi:MAG: DUF2330 domain-containing protein [Alphaproteobacteria bacterium]|nr:DUF2330 domain-containing protein [Alphaproteobacteria bacterium]